MTSLTSSTTTITTTTSGDKSRGWAWSFHFSLQFEQFIKVKCSSNLRDSPHSSILHFRIATKLRLWSSPKSVTIINSSQPPHAESWKYEDSTWNSFGIQSNKELIWRNKIWKCRETCSYFFTEVTGIWLPQSFCQKVWEHLQTIHPRNTPTRTRTSSVHGVCPNVWPRLSSQWTEIMHDWKTCRIEWQTLFLCPTRREIPAPLPRVISWNLPTKVQLLTKTCLRN